MGLIQNWTGKSLQALHDPEDADEIRIKLPPNTTAPWGQVLVETGTPGTYAPIAGAPLATDKLLLLKYDITTDAAGLHYKGTGTGAPEQADVSCTAFKSGEFDTRDLKGVAGAAITQAMCDALGKLRQGTPAAGILRLI